MVWIADSFFLSSGVPQSCLKKIDVGDRRHDPRFQKERNLFNPVTTRDKECTNLCTVNSVVNSHLYKQVKCSWRRLTQERLMGCGKSKLKQPIITEPGCLRILALHQYTHTYNTLDFPLCRQHFTNCRDNASRSGDLNSTSHI
jgi:hypothetical protein